MNQQSYGTDVRLSRLERELSFWRILGLVATVSLTLAFHSAGTDKPDKEFRFVSADGRQTVVLSAEGLSLLTKDKTVARLTFAPVGESEKLEAELMLSGGISAGQEGLTIHAGKDLALLNAQHLNFLQGLAMRTSLSTDGLELSDSLRRARITLSTPDQGLGGLRFLDQQKAILSLGALGLFRGDNPPRRDVGAIQLGDFGTPPKGRLITPSEGELQAP
jgi:hypothetical protein